MLGGGKPSWHARVKNVPDIELQLRVINKFGNAKPAAPACKAGNAAGRAVRSVLSPGAFIERDSSGSYPQSSGGVPERQAQAQQSHATHGAQHHLTDVLDATVGGADTAAGGLMPGGGTAATRGALPAVAEHTRDSARSILQPQELVEAGVGEAEGVGLGGASLPEALRTGGNGCEGPALEASVSWRPSGPLSQQGPLQGADPVACAADRPAQRSWTEDQQQQQQQQHQHSLSEPATAAPEGQGRPVTNLTNDIPEYLKVGDVVTGAVLAVQPSGVVVDAGSFLALLPALHVSESPPDDLGALFRVGERLRALVADVQRQQHRVVLSTRALERTPGDMLRDRQLVYDGAEEMAERWRQHHLEQLIGLVVEGAVTSTAEHWARLDLGGGLQGMLFAREISGKAVGHAGRVFGVGDRVRAVVLGRGTRPGQVLVSTRRLEPNPGDMLRNPQLVYDNAEAMAERWRQRAGQQAGAVEAEAPSPPPGGEHRPNRIPDDLEVGHLVEGEVASVTSWGVLVDLGSYRGCIHSRDLSAHAVQSPALLLQPGDRVRAVVTAVNRDRGHVDLSTRLLESSPGDMLRDRQLVYDSAEEMAERCRGLLMERLQVGSVVQGVVCSVDSYGARLDLSTGGSGLLPSREISRYRVADPQQVLRPGDAVRALVIKAAGDDGGALLSTRYLEPTGGDMLYDRQAVYDNAEEMAEHWRQRRNQALAASNTATEAQQRSDIPDSLQVGDVVDGIVTSLQPYGVFVRSGSLNALLHVSDLSHTPLKSPAEVLLPYDHVRALVLSIDRQQGRVKLSTKALEQDPGDMVIDPRLVYAVAEETAARWRREQLHVQSHPDAQGPGSPRVPRGAGR